jgi:hypothetical protein
MPRAELLKWEEDQLVDYTRVAGVDAPIIHFYDFVNAYDSPGTGADANIVLTLDPNLLATADCTGKRNWKIIFPEYQRVEVGKTWTIEQAGVGVTTAPLVQYQAGIVTPHVLELYWDPALAPICLPTDVVFSIDNSQSISGSEWLLMMNGIMDIVDNLQTEINNGLVRVGLNAWNNDCPSADLIINLSGNYANIVSAINAAIATRPGQGNTSWEIGLDYGYNMLTDPLYFDPDTEKILVFLTDGSHNADCAGLSSYTTIANGIKSGTYAGNHDESVPVELIGIAINSVDAPQIVPELQAIVSGTSPWTGTFFDVATFEDFQNVTSSIAAVLGCKIGKYRIVKYELENFMGDKYTDPNAIGHNFTSKIKNAVWFFDEVNSNSGSATIIPIGSTIFIRDAFIVPQGNLGGTGTFLSVGLSEVDNTGATATALTTNINLTTAGVATNSSLQIIRNPAVPSTYATNGPTYGVDNTVCFVRNSVPVMLSAVTDAKVTGGFWVVVPYLTLKPDYTYDDIDTTYDLWVTAGCGGGGGGTSGSSGSSGTSGAGGIGAGCREFTNLNDDLAPFTSGYITFRRSSGATTTNPSLVTNIRVNWFDSTGANVGDEWLLALLNHVSISGCPAQITVTQADNPSAFGIYNVTAVVQSGVDYYQITVSHLAGTVLFTAPSNVIFCYTLFGCDGASGTSGSSGSSGTSGTSGGGSTVASYSLPVPNLRISLPSVTPNNLNLWRGNPASPATFNTLDPVNATLLTFPYVTATDITEELLANYRVFVEMLVYRRRGDRKSGYVVPSPWFPTIIPPNSSPYFPWGSNFWTRSGDHYAQDGQAGNPPVLFAVDRPNHYEVTTVNQTIPVWQYLHGRFTRRDVKYRDASGTIATATGVIVPNTLKHTKGRKPSDRFAYSNWVRPLYVAFRYILWDSAANGGDGQIFAGPVSKTLVVSTRHFPFDNNWGASGLYGVPCADINTSWSGKKNEMHCWFATKLPS